jgi:DNA-binding NarL/FixJ family response regulator
MVLLDITMDDLDGWETAALLRQLMPPEKLPIVFVSANLFDHQPERLVEMQCQGFVGKPIIESELLEALEHALQIEWVRDNTPRSLAGSSLVHPDVATERPNPENLPDTLREELGRLARQGHATALRETLRKALAAHPEHTITLHFLQGLAERFDFQTLSVQLREPDHDRSL